MLNVSSAAEGLTMDLLPGDKTQKLTETKWGEEISIQLHTIAWHPER